MTEIQAALYHQIVQQRIEVIEKLLAHLDDNALEKVLQDHLFENLWLLDPGWERATDRKKEERIGSSFADIDATLKPEERDARMDIRYKRTGGMNVIVELKRRSVQVADYEIMEQVQKYKDVVQRHLDSIGSPEALEVVVVVGRELKGWDTSQNKTQSIQSLAQKNIRVVQYDKLLADAQAGYREYLDAQHDLGRIQRLLMELADDPVRHQRRRTVDGPAVESRSLQSEPSSAILELVADLSVEFSKREALMHALATEFAQNAVLTSKWLGRVDFGFGPERVKDVGKGIWNPSSYAGTLTIVSDPDSEYDDGDHGDSLYRYSYEKRPPGQDPRGGSNNKLREAMRLGLPIVMLRKVADGRFVPVMPVYVVKEEPEHRRFLLALDESLRFLPGPGSSHRGPAPLRRAGRPPAHASAGVPLTRSRRVRAQVRSVRPQEDAAPRRRAHHVGRRGGRAAGRHQRPRPLQDPPRRVRREHPRDLARLLWSTSTRTC